MINYVTFGKWGKKLQHLLMEQGVSWGGDVTMPVKPESKMLILILRTGANIHDRFFICLLWRTN